MEAGIKNLVLAGIGTIAYTYERASSMVDELVKKGELTINQGREINDELKRKVFAGKSAEPEEAPLTARTFKEILKDMDLATRSEIDELKERIEKLENKA